MAIRVSPAMIAFLISVMQLGFNARTAIAQSGKQDYEKYCADCHGPGGRGNGSAPQFIPKNWPPSDLTLLVKKNGGEFPFDEVADTIDGRKIYRRMRAFRCPSSGPRFRSPARSSRPKATLR